MRRAAFTSYDPLPTEQLKREKRVEIEPDWTVEKLKKTASTVRSPLGRIRVGLLFSTKVLWGGGSLAEERRQRAARWVSPIWIVRLPAIAARLR